MAGFSGGGGGGGVTPPSGANTEIQYNNSGAFGGSPEFFWDNASKKRSILGETHLIPTGQSGFGIERNFVYRRMFIINMSGGTTYETFLTVRPVLEGTVTPANKWICMSYRVIIQGGRGFVGNSSRLQEGVVEWRFTPFADVAAYSITNASAGSTAAGNFRVACDATAKTAKFEYDPYVAPGTSFDGGIFVELFCSETGGVNGTGFTFEITT